MTAKLLDRKSLLKREAVEIERVDLDAENFVFVKQMTGRERDTFEQSLLKEQVNEKGEITGYDRSMTDFRAKLSVVTLCDEKGNTLLLPSDYEELSKSMSAVKLEKIVNAAQKLNKITEEDKEALVKNLGGDQVASSTSNSAGN